MSGSNEPTGKHGNDGQGAMDCIRHRVDIKVGDDWKPAVQTTFLKRKHALKWMWAQEQEHPGTLYRICEVEVAA